MSNYGYTGEDVIAIQLLSYRVDSSKVKYVRPKISLEILGDNRDLADVGRVKYESVINSVLPISMDLKEYGNPLSIVEANEKLSSVVWVA